MEIPKIVRQVLQDWNDERIRHLEEDFETYEQMKEDAEYYDDIKKLNEVRKFLGDNSNIKIEDFKADYEQD